MSDDSRFDRRTVLRTTGAALAGLGAVGPATAGHLSGEDCARVVEDALYWNGMCPSDDPGLVLEAGTEGTVLDICHDDVLGEVIHFERDDGEVGWITTTLSRSADHCSTALFYIAS